VFFRLSTWELWLIIAGVVLGFALGYLTGRVLRRQADTLREPVGIVQGAFFELVGLILAFGLTLAIGRYDARRAGVVDAAAEDGPDAPNSRADARTVVARSTAPATNMSDLFMTSPLIVAAPIVLAARRSSHDGR
jgi:hypothetical protein